MCPYDREIENIKSQILKLCNPEDIILFGSYAKGRVSKHSDIDICIIIDTDKKRKLINELLVSINCDTDLDIVVYTPYEWLKYKDEKAVLPTSSIRQE